MEFASHPEDKEVKFYTVGGFLGSKTFDKVDVTSTIIKAFSRAEAAYKLMKLLFDEEWIEEHMERLEEDYEEYLEEEGEDSSPRGEWFFQSLESWAFDYDTVWLNEATLVE